MASVVSREAYFETGLGVLSDLGYGGLKPAARPEGAIRVWSSVGKRSCSRAGRAVSNATDFEVLGVEILAQ